MRLFVTELESAGLCATATRGSFSFDNYWFNEHITVTVYVPLQDGFTARKQWSFDVQTNYVSSGQSLLTGIATKLIKRIASVVDVIEALLLPKTALSC